METNMEKLSKYFDGQGITQKEIAKRLGVTPQYVNALFSGRTKIGKRTAERLANYFNLSYSWLLTGEGSMLRDGEQQAQTTEAEGSLCYDIMTIQGGSGHGTGMERITRADMAVGRMLAPGLPVGEGIIYIQVRGNSMVNHRDPSHSIPDGAWVGIRQATSSAIRWGEVYALMTTDGAVVKKLLPADTEDKIRLVSFNDEDGYKPYDIPVEEIIWPLYTVVGVVNATRWM